MDEVERVVIVAAATVAGIAKEEITPGRQLQDMGIDSLEFISLVRVVEESLDTILPDEETAKAVTIGDLVETVRRAQRLQTENGDL